MGLDLTMINDVSDTSFWVAHYRAIESARPDALFKDPFAEKLVGERGRKIAESMPKIGRYTAWSVVSRTVIIDKFLFDAIAEGVDAVVNLGCGLDARPYRLKLPPTLDWVEVDFPHIIEYKTEKLKDEKPACRLTRIAVDLSNDEDRRRLLGTVVPNAKKVLVLTEGVLPYLTPDQVATLGRDLHDQSRFAYWVAEYFDKMVYPYLRSTIRSKAMKNSPFLFYPDDWHGFFAKLGWKQKSIRYAAEVAEQTGRKVPMPWYAPIGMFFMPKAKLEQLKRLTGYMVFERAEPATRA